LNFEEGGIEMAVPKKKMSKSRMRRRRARFYAARSVNLVKCPKCGALKLPHRDCRECGEYNGRQVLEV